jgi:hypothetical protein
MVLFKLGENKTIIGIDEVFIHCPSCESYQWSDIMVSGKYFHLYWIPIFPLDKELNIICRKCGLKRYGLSFNSKIISNYGEIKDKFRHPWYTYIGICILIVFILTIIIVRILK